MVFLLPSLLSVFLVLSLSSAQDADHKENTTLLLVQALFRHGERAPIFIYNNDPNTKYRWPDGLGKLTRRGKRHHYALGKFLRSMYRTYLTSDPKEVFVNSSGLDRCLRGAEVTVGALYEPEGIWKFEDDLKWQPIPVYYLPKDRDKYLLYESPCPRAFQELFRLSYSKDRQKEVRKHQKMLKEVSNYIKMDISSVLSVLFYDTVNVEKMYNLTIPTLIDNYYDEIHEFADATFQYMFGSDLILRLRIGPFLQQISENMKNKINGITPDLKIHLYCVQDVQVNAVFAALNITNMRRVPYCGTLLFELHVMADASTAVRLLYLNSTDPLNIWEPHVLVLDDCSEFCPLANFTEKFQHLVPENWEQECQLNTSDSSTTRITSDSSIIDNTSVTILIVIFIFIIVVICLVAFGVSFYYKRKIKQREEQSLSSIMISFEKNLT